MQPNMMTGKDSLIHYNFVGIGPQMNPNMMGGMP